jgi:hypothetical protein
MNKPLRPPRSVDYEIGYGRPPESTRFQPGRSGNPKGRPRKRKTIDARIQENLARRLKVEENGRSRSLPVEEIILRRLVNAAAKGDLKAVKLLYELQARYRDAAAESFDPQDLRSDKAILDAYVFARLTGPNASAPGTADVKSDSENAPDATSEASCKPAEEV